MRSLDRYEWLLLGALAVLSLWVLALDLGQVISDGRVWTGTDGVYIVDQLQYLSWIRSASEHLLAANLFVLRPTPADYFQPAVVISAGLTLIGIPATIALLVWKPVAVLAIFFAVRTYANASLSDRLRRRVALTLGLFFASFTVAYGSFTTLGDLSPVFLSWGYTFGLIALAAILAALVLHGRARERGRLSVWPGVLGAVASLLHPWHGELFLLVLVGGELLMWALRRRASLRPAALTIVLTALPLLYYAVLGKSDESWKLARVASKHSFSLWPLVIYLIPLGLPALLALRRRPDTFVAAASRAWLGATLLLFVLSATALGATPLHAFEGVTIPLGVLAVQGIADLHLRLPRAVMWAAVAVATIPGLAMQMKTARDLAVPTAENANFIRAGERDAMAYLARVPGPGGVLTRSYLGSAIPTRTGRRTYIGDCLWSQPGCLLRTAQAENLFSGQMTDDDARALVRNIGARFLLADCEAAPGFARPLSALVRRVSVFGCARVFEITHPGSPLGPLADSTSHAVVRPAWRQ